jgi:hypothetical protein
MNEPWHCQYVDGNPLHILLLIESSYVMTKSLERVQELLPPIVMHNIVKTNIVIL